MTTNKGTPRYLLDAESKMTKMCAKMVPKNFTQKQEGNRKNISYHGSEKCIREEKGETIKQQSC